MAASVTATFTIIDKASGAMRRMERQAKQTDRAFRSMGDGLDAVASRDTSRNLEITERNMRSMGRTSQSVNRDFDVMNRRGSTVTKTLAKLGGAFTGLRGILSLLKIPAIIAGFGALVQVVGALSAGVVALTPRLASMAGIMATIPAGLTAMGLGMAAVTMATKGLGEALGGNEEALKKLTPQGRQFLQTLKEFKPAMDHLRQASQEGLFPGLDKALRSARKGMPALRDALRGAGSAVGQGTAGLAKQLTTPAALRDFTNISGQANRILGSLFDTIGNVIRALEHVAVAARPLTMWLREQVEAFGEWAVHAAKAGRETGTLREYFERTKRALTDFGHILSDLWGVFQDIGEAARPLGESIWKGWVEGAERLHKLTSSAQGFSAMRGWFNQMRAPLHELWMLTKELAAALGRLSVGSEATRMLHSLRSLIGPLEEMVRGITRAFGPTMVDTIVHLVNAFNTFRIALGQWGRLINVVVRGLDWLLSNVPGLTNVIGAFVAAMTFTKIFGPLGRLRMMWGGVAAATTQAAVAQSRYNAAALGGAAVGVRGGRAGPGTVPGTPMMVPYGAAGASSTRVGGVVAGGSGYMGQTLKNARAGYYSGGKGLSGLRTGAGALGRGVAGAPAAVGAAASGASLAGGLGKIGGLARAAGKFLLPVSLLFGALDAFSAFSADKGNVLQKGGAGLQGALSGATFGLVPGPATAQEERATGKADAGKFVGDLGTAGNITAMRDQLAQLREERNRITTEAGSDDMIEDIFGGHDEEYKAQADAMQKTIDKMEKMRAEAAKIRNMRQQEREVASATAFTGQLNQAFTVGSKNQGAGAAFASLTAGAVDQMSKMGPQGQKIIAQNTLAWAREQAKDNPKLTGTFKDLRRDILHEYSKTGRDIQLVNGRILNGSKKEWGSIKDVMVNNAVEAQRQVKDAFTALQQQAIGSLTAMGYSPGSAQKIVQGMEDGQTQRAATASASAGSGAFRTSSGAGGRLTGGKDHARGGRISGIGLSDNVNIGGGNKAAAGELIVNRHTEARVNQLLGGRTSLGKEVAGEGRPHSAGKSWLTRHSLGGRAGTPSASGGVAEPPGDPGTEVVQSAYAGVVGKFLQRFGMDLTQGYNPSGPSVSPGHLSLSAAPSLDVVPLNGDWDGAFVSGIKWALSQGMQVGYDGSIPGTQTWENHGRGNHAHIDWGGDTSASDIKGGALAAGGAIGTAVKAIRLKGMRSGLKGVPGAMAQRGMDAIKSGMERKINKKIGAGMGGTMGMAGAGGLNHAWPQGSSDALPEATVAKLAESVGLPGVTFAQIAHGESNFQPGAYGTDPGGTHGLGLWQITTGYNDDIIKQMGGVQAMFNPVVNARAAKSIYDRAGIGAWYGTQFMTDPNAHLGGGKGMAMGGRVGWGGWHGQGGSFTTNRPTIIGVGESGQETVTVTPKGGGAGGVRIGKIVVHNHREGDIRRQIEREINQAFNRAGSALANQTIAGD